MADLTGMSLLWLLKTPIRGCTGCPMARFQRLPPTLNSNCGCTCLPALPSPVVHPPQPHLLWALALNIPPGTFFPPSSRLPLSTLWSLPRCQLTEENFPTSFNVLPLVHFSSHFSLTDSLHVSALSPPLEGEFLRPRVLARQSSQEDLGQRSCRRPIGSRA